MNADNNRWPEFLDTSSPGHRRKKRSDSSEEDSIWEGLVPTPRGKAEGSATQERPVEKVEIRKSLAVSSSDRSRSGLDISDGNPSAPPRPFVNLTVGSRSVSCPTCSRVIHVDTPQYLVYRCGWPFCGRLFRVNICNLIDVTAGT